MTERRDNGKPAEPVSQLQLELEPKTSLPLPASQLERKGAAETRWNTKNLLLRLASDAASAACAATLIAPLISIIDR